MEKEKHSADKLSTAQLRKIYAAANEAGLDNDMLHAAVYRETGREHISELTKSEAIKVIDSLSGTSTSAVSTNGTRMTAKQASYIKGLSEEMGWNEKRLAGFVKKIGHVDRLEWLDRYSAGKVIEGLKKLKEKGESAYGNKKE